MGRVTIRANEQQMEAGRWERGLRKLSAGLTGTFLALGYIHVQMTGRGRGVHLETEERTER